MTVNDDKLSKLNKALSQKAETFSNKNSWQEPLSRFTSVNLERSAQSAEVIKGISGSWAAFYAKNSTIRDDSSTLSAPPVQSKLNRLGLPGVPEINFAPFSAYTHRFGPKGPSLLGHPISFSIVGPTMKAPALDIQLEITDNTGLAGGDVLTLSTRSIYSPPGGPADAPRLASISDVYGPIALADFPGGLYLTIAATGAPGTIEGNLGGLGDSYIYDDSGALGPIVPITSNSKFEIFRVTAINATNFVIDPNKRLSSYFTIPGGVIPACRAITVFEPFATRCSTIPDSGSAIGKERVFSVSIPEIAANSDYLPPYNGSAGGPGDGTWLNGGFDLIEPGSSVTGVVSEYTERVALPVPIPVINKRGQAQRLAGGPAPVFPTAGKLNILVDAADVDVADIGKVIHITAINRKGSSELQVLTAGKMPLNSFLGWYEVNDVDAGTDIYTLRRIVEVNPTNGKIFYGLPEALILDNSGSATDRLYLEFSVHDTISSVHLNSYSDLDKIDSIRLTNIINPEWVERSPKTTPKGSTPARADRAIFDTVSSGGGAAGTNANPGSLLDLGFRMVLFPAKEDPGAAGYVIPDWDNPITSNEVVLDPSITTEDQFITIDYSSGLIYLSHEPVPGAGCDIAPNGIVTAGVSTGNPRSEIILFASCVPFSLEKGQSGGGSRVRGGLIPSDDRVSVGDVFSARVYASLDAVVDSAGQSLSSGSNITLDLIVDAANDPFPPTGYVDLVLRNPEGLPLMDTPTNSNRASTFGYQGKIFSIDTQTGRTYMTLLGVHGGGDNADPPTLLGAGKDGDFLAVLRRDINAPNEDDGTAGADYQLDTTYGFSYRPSSILIQDGELTAEDDGSLSVKIRRLDDHENLFNDIFSSHLISGGVVTGGTGLYILVSEATILSQGRRVVLPLYDSSLPASVTRYIYIDTSDASFPVIRVTSSLPLPATEDILLARVDTGVGSVSNVIDMRTPLLDTDLKLDILVGQTTGYPSQTISHFDTLKEAIEYVGEVADPASGLDGSYFKIKVVGFTNEATTITLPTDGVIVEGAAIRGSGSESHGIRYNDPVTNLIDFNGKQDWVFRDLQFEYIDPGPANTNPAQRNVFSGSMTGGRFENIKFNGNDKSHGFYYGSATDSLISCVFENCTIEAVTDFGIYILDGGSIFNTLFDSCNLTATNAAKITTAPDPAGFRLPQSSSPATSFSVKIQNCKIQYFEFSIKSSASDSVFENNTLISSRQNGIIISPSLITPDDIENVWIQNNSLRNVYTQAPIGVKAGIVIDRLAPDNIEVVHVLNNRIVLDTTVPIAAGDADILSDGSSLIIKGNILDTADLLVSDTSGGTKNVIANNIVGVGGGIYVRSDESIIDSNVVLGTETISTSTFGAVITGGSITTDGSNIIVSNNTALQGIRLCELQGQRNTVSNNIVGSLTNTADIHVESQSHIISGNQVFGNIDAATASGGFMFIENNVLPFVGIKAITLGISNSNSKISGNFIQQGNIDNDAPEVIISTNQVNNGSIIDAGLSNVQIRGNSVFNGSITRTGAGAEGIIDANIVEFTVTTSSVSDLVSNNQIGTDLTLSGNFAQAFNNNIGGDVSSTATDLMFSNNRVGGTVTVTQTRPTVSNNVITGDLDLQLATSAYIVMGNRLARVTNTSGGGPGDPDAGGGILVGNRYTAATPEFAGAPTGGTGAKDNNV